MKQTIAIIGAGAVGATSAYALILTKIAANILMVDIDAMRCKGEVIDLSDACSFMNKSSSISVGTFEDARNAQIIVISAGARQKPGQSRTELLSTNKKVIEHIINNLQPINPSAIILMVSNPLDILAYDAWKLSGLPPAQVFGTGTLLDSKRLGGIISQQVGIAQESVHGYILGEHGDSQFPAWSMSRINGLSLSNFPKLTTQVLSNAADTCRNKAYEIISCKQATYYGIGTCVATICQAILEDQKIILPLSCFIKEWDVFLSVPVVLGTGGIETILPLTLNDKEQEQLKQSAQKIKKLME